MSYSEAGEQKKLNENSFAVSVYQEILDYITNAPDIAVFMRLCLAWHNVGLLLKDLRSSVMVTCYGK